MSVVAVNEHNDEDDETYVINGSLVGRSNIDDMGEAVRPDPFAAEGDDLKKIRGLSTNNKRRLTNQLNKVYSGVKGTGSKSLADETITGYDAFQVTLPPYNLDHLAKLYEVSPPHKAAVDAKVANIVGLGYDLVETSVAKRGFEAIASNKAKVEKLRKKLSLEKERIIDLIDSLNEEDTFYETMAKVWKDYETTGNGYIEIGRTDNGQIGYIGHVNSTSLRVRRERDGYVQIMSDKAVFFRNFGDRKTADPFGDDNNPNELIHIKKYAPSSAYYGIPDIIAAKNAVAGNEFAARFNLDYFENKAVPRHLIILKGATLGSQTATHLMEFFETGFKGKNHRSLFIPLPADAPDGRKVEFRIEPIEATVQDSSFKEFKKQNLGEILMAHRVPISKVGMAEGVSLAVARDADKTFKEQVCQPEQKVFEKKINRIIKEFTDMLQIDLNEMTLTDADTQSKIWERLAKIGAITRNEIRAELGKTGIEKGDEIIDINAKPGNEPAAEERARGNRSRDAARSAGATDSAGEGRNAKGEGRTAE